MFQKPAFGANTSGFGATSSFGGGAVAGSSPFGGFKAGGATGAFGAAPAFGATPAAQPAQQGGLFSGSSTAGGLFGAAAPAFGSSPGGFSFGSNTSGGGLFNSNASSGGLFQPQQNNTAFGAKPPGFGFGATSTQSTTGSSLFGNTQQAGTSLFGQNTNMGGGSLFNSTAGAFGASASAGSGTAHVKYAPLVGTDVVVKSGASQSINIKHHCITCMKEYEGKSLEELRLEDYTAGRKGAAQGVFGFQQPQENKPLFGATSTFGAPATSAAPSVFGGGALSSAAFPQTNTFSFGGAAQNNTNTSGLFGTQKPAFGAATSTGTGLFGAPASTQAPTFGTNTSTFGFGSNLQTQNSGGLFGAKPAGGGLGSAGGGLGSAGGGLGAFGGGLFAKPPASQAPAFGATQTGAGSMSGAGGFGSGAASGGLFASSFGKPSTSQPSFGFGAPQPTLGVGGGLGAGAFGANKPATGFGTLGAGVFPQQQNTFRTGLDSGLGGGLFGNSSLGGPSLGVGLGANNSAINLSGASAAGNVHEQILALAARPYGDSPLFKELRPHSSTTAEDALKPTNPAAQAGVLAREGPYRVTSPRDARLLLQPRPPADKKSLFEGLEQADDSLNDKLSLKPSRKRLVLRANRHDTATHGAHYRHEELSPEIRETEGEGKENSNPPDDGEREKSGHTHDDGSGRSRQSSWLSGSKAAWSEPAQDTTPRLYPSLEKDLQTEVSERRASWLTTKPLRLPALAADSAESSVRELAVRPPPADRVDALSVSEEELPPPAPVAPPPHPAGVKCTRPGYYTIPSLDEMTKYIGSDGSCVVPHLTVGRTNYGNLHYDEPIDVKGLDIDALVHFLNKEVIVYPEDADKPAVGEGLNRRAVVTLDRVWPRDKTQKRLIDDPQRLAQLDYEGKLRRVCDKHDTKFIEYRPQTGSWVFRVEHFSKYGLSDSDEEDEPPPLVLQRQLVQQTLSQSAPLTANKPQSGALPSGPGGLLTGPGGLPVGPGGLAGGLPSGPGGLAGGLGGAGGIGGLGLSGGGLVSVGETTYNTQNSFNITGTAKAFDMDATEESTESHSMYQDTRAFSVKSPTSELARLERRQSARVQLMKASLYADTEMEDDISVSTGDQLVPLSAPSPPPPGTGGAGGAKGSTPSLAHTYTEDEKTHAPADEPELPPLLVQPHSIILRYHGKIPPFKHTIAGGLRAARVAELSVSRARHSRAGFAPGLVLAHVATRRALAALDKHAELSALGAYVAGRGEDDWSEASVMRLALSRPHTDYNLQEVVSRHLDSLLPLSTFVPGDADAAPCLQLADNAAALHQILADAQTDAHRHQPFGVSGAYCLEVWKLCDALWGADLDNGGVPGTSEQWLVGAQRRFESWLATAAADVTDRQLEQPTRGEDEDELDGHSARVWTLLLGGRVLEACRVAREHGDYNMAALIAQAAGEPAFRGLISRQLSLWRECGADSLIARHKLATLQLLAGQPPLPLLRAADWRQALLATARYLCPQVPTLEQVIRRYEELFSRPDAETDEEDTEVDLTRLPYQEMDMQFPLPPYCADYDVSVSDTECPRRVLDLRYSLLRARALNLRPRPRPAQATPDPFDYSLCFLLEVWFGHPSAESVAGVADQLEASGDWLTAIHALTYLPDDKLRSRLIRGMLSRHAPAQADPSCLERLQRLRVPQNWLLTAQAHRAKYEHLPYLEAQHLTAAGQWNGAHRLVLDELLTDAVLADELQRLCPLLDRLGEAAARGEVSGWRTGGQPLTHYLHVCREVRALSESGCGGAELAARLAALRPRLAQACPALPRVNNKSPAALAARAEMGARLVQTACGAGGAGPLAALLAALALPPGGTQHALHEITSELAERAGELCMESGDSPAASRHAARALHTH